jgi:hypothetical protein
VHIHATSAYVDLPANAATSALVLVAFDAWASPTPAGARALLTAGIASAIAVNTKTLSHPIVLVALVAVAVRALPELRRGRRLLAFSVVLLPVVFWTPLANLVTHHNPYFPVRLSVLGHILPGPEEPYASSPDWLAGVPRPARFVASLAEVGLRPMTDTRRWTVDQWMPSDAAGYRMGGFFGAYVLVHVAFLAWRARSDRSRMARVHAIGFVAFTALVAVLPQSHELRYYMCWMIVLVATNLRLAGGVAGRRAIGIGAAAALGIVLAVTRAAYAYPSGSTFRDLVRETTDEGAISGARGGERICVDREPYDLPWAAAFHPGARAYVVVEAEPSGDCAGARKFP